MHLFCWLVNNPRPRKEGSDEGNFSNFFSSMLVLKAGTTSAVIGGGEKSLEGVLTIKGKDVAVSEVLNRRIQSATRKKRHRSICE